MRLQIPTAVNYRGERLSVALGVAMAGETFVLLAANTIRHGRLWWVLGGAGAVFLAGFYDDSRPSRTRGMRAQIGALSRGKVTPGIVKLLVICGAGAFTAWMLGARGGRFAVGAAALAGSANLWNLLDVRPGRALKLFLPATIGLSFAAYHLSGAVFPVLFVTAALALVADLREVSMLGDCGANVLGFMVGVGMLLVLPFAWLFVVLGAIVVLHVLADTVTLSRIIDATPPLRWLDALGRKKFATRD